MNERQVRYEQQNKFNIFNSGIDGTGQKMQSYRDINNKNMNINNGVELYKKRTNKSEIYEEKTKDNNYFNEYINIHERKETKNENNNSSNNDNNNKMIIIIILMIKVMIAIVLIIKKKTKSH